MIDEEELKKLREKKRKELQKQMSGQMSDSDQKRQQEQMEKMKQQRKQQLRKVLTGDALERFNRVKMVNSDLATQLESYLIRLKQMGQLQKKITESQLKKILKSIKNEQKTEWNIKRR